MVMMISVFAEMYESAQSRVTHVCCQHIIFYQLWYHINSVIFKLITVHFSK